MHGDTRSTPEGASQGATPDGFGEGATSDGPGQSATPDGFGEGATLDGPGQGATSDGPGQGATPEGPGRGTTLEEPGRGAMPEGLGRGSTPEGSGRGATPEGLGQGAPLKGPAQGATPEGLGQDSAAVPGPATWACPEGMDPSSSYLLKIKLFGNRKKARKDIRCFCFEKVIDCDLTYYKDLVESIVEQYLPDVVLCPNKERDKDYIFEDDSEVESEVEDDEVEDDEVEEDEELHEAEHPPHVEYDKLNPPMTKGFIYPNMKEFKLALSQHAIKREFEYNTEYSTRHRFRG
ncbi:hypothetical protein D1007_54065 [Hordeum vulgare]|nr:hypothetical protein D1007_54065 [Hordeum vulgare]